MSILAAVGEQQEQSQIIETAVDLATAFDEELYVLHVIPEADADEHFEAIQEIDEFRDVDFSIEVDRAESIAETLVERTLDDRTLDRFSPVGRIGKPSVEILAVADDIDPRFLVIGGKRRSPTGKAVFGSVTQSVILDSEWPVVTYMSDSS